MFAAVTPILILLAAIFVRADPNPTNPGPGDVFTEGGPCLIGWDVDTTGLWTTMSIELMTGDNINMVTLATVATVDGTNPSKNTFSFTCPQVTPHSAIYFYQFTSPSTSDKTWTGRFTITDSANDIVPPTESTQPDGEKIPWGIGSLANGSSSTTSSVSAGSVTNSSTSVTTVSPSTTPSSPAPSTSASTTLTPSVVVVTTDISATPSIVSTANGAVATLATSNVFQAGLALGLAAFGFSVMF